VIEIVEVTEPTAHLAIAVEIFGPEIRALQTGARRRPRALAVGGWFSRWPRRSAGPRSASVASAFPRGCSWPALTGCA
jgi:hypothetical protein